jgi:hypothetical protein
MEFLRHDEETVMISAAWLKENWTRFIWPETPATDVNVIPKQ